MGQSINAASFRLGGNPQYRKLWLCSKWGSENLIEYAKNVKGDHIIHQAIKDKMPILECYYRVIVERLNSKVMVNIECLSLHLDNINSMIKTLKKHIIAKAGHDIKLVVSLLPTYLAVGYRLMYTITNELIMNPKANINYVLKRATAFAMRTHGFIGANIVCSGRIRGAAIANREKYSDGNVQSSSISKNVFQLSHGLKLPSGVLGIKIKYQYFIKNLLKLFNKPRNNRGYNSNRSTRGGGAARAPNSSGRRNTWRSK